MSPEKTHCPFAKAARAACFAEELREPRSFEMDLYGPYPYGYVTGKIDIFVHEWI
jgi:hypothetical protein